MKKVISFRATAYSATADESLDSHHAQARKAKELENAGLKRFVNQTTVEERPLTEDNRYRVPSTTYAEAESAIVTDEEYKTIVACGINPSVHATIDDTVRDQYKNEFRIGIAVFLMWNAVAIAKIAGFI